MRTQYEIESAFADAIMSLSTNQKDFEAGIIALDKAVMSCIVKMTLQSHLIDELITTQVQQQETIEALSDRVTLLVGNTNRLLAAQQQGLGDK